MLAYLKRLVNQLMIGDTAAHLRHGLCCRLHPPGRSRLGAFALTLWLSLRGGRGGRREMSSGGHPLIPPPKRRGLFGDPSIGASPVSEQEHIETQGDTP